MRTDKELLKIFEAEPDWVFQLTGLPSPGACALRSITIKSVGWSNGSKTRERRRSRPCCWENFRPWRKPNPEKT